MIAYLIGGISSALAVMNGVAAYCLYRQYCILITESMEFAGRVLIQIKEENGEIEVNPTILSGEVMDHISRISGLVKWIRG